MNVRHYRLMIALAVSVAAMPLSAPASPSRPDLPTSSRRYGIFETQRIRFKNAPLFKQANGAVIKGDDDRAIRLFRAILANDPGNNQAKLALITLYDRQGQYREGIALCGELIRAYPDYAAAYHSRGYLAMKNGRFDLAAESWEEELKHLPADDNQRRKVLFALGQAYGRGLRYYDAERVYAEALSISFDADTALAYVYILQAVHKTEKVRAVLERLLATTSAPSLRSKVIYELAMLEYLEGHYRACRERLNALPEQPASAQLLAGMAFMKEGMSGPALEYFNRIEPGLLAPDERWNFYRNRAYLNFDQGLSRESFLDAEDALDMEPCADMALLRLKALASLRFYDDVEREGQMLLKSEKIPLTAAEKGQAFLITGRCQYLRQNYASAIASMTNAFGLDSSLTETLYLQGLAHYARGEYQQTVTNYQTYLDLNPQPPAAFWGDLGQAEGKQREYKKGTAALGKSLAYHSVDVATLSDQGYQFMKWNHNRASKDSFQRAIDLYADLVPRVPTNETSPYRRGETAAKEEYTKLDKIFSLQGYLSQNTYDFPTNAGISSVQGALPSQYGLELALRPPLIGFRDEKILEIFGDVLGNFKKNSWSPDQDSYQGMAGIRYKPFSKVNFNTSFAKLMKIGDNSEDNWLWRNMASWERGEKPAPDASARLNIRLFGDAGYYLEERSRWYGYLDGRAGPALKLSQNALLTIPQVMGILRGETNDSSDFGSYGLLGLGGTLRLFDPERRYTIHRFYFDIFAYYTVGRFKSTPESFDQPGFNGFMFGINVVK